MNPKNYYKIMGVAENATPQEIKTAYRKLARKYHPDISKEANAEAQFKEMGEAYEVLKDPKKRAEYDQYLKYQEYNQRSEPFQESQQSNRHQYQSFDADFFESLFGQRYKNQPMQGQDYSSTIQISLEDAYNGAERNIQIPIEKGREVTLQTLKVKIPKGIKSGQQIRLAGQGGSGINNGPRGDLYITVNIQKHPLFDLMDNDIYLTLPITPWEAALGTTLTVPTLSGKIDLKIPIGSQSGQKLRIKNRGLGHPAGDQYVLLKIATPPANTQEAKEFYQKMASVMPFNPRVTKGV